MEHKKKIWLKGILAVALFIMVFITYLSPVFAAINNEYNSDTGVTQAPIKNSLEKSNPLVSPIASFVYFIGSVIEWLLGSLTGMVTGMNTMPWADMILYNAVPMLDINFLNPDPNSMVKQLNGVILKIYFTIFSLALAFFGIAVVIMAIKLAISTIAEEKAKYKSAITNWLMAVVLLFTMHYFMSFIFYLNESVVVMASNIAIDSLKDKDFSVNGGVAYENFRSLLKEKYAGNENVEKYVDSKSAFYIDFLNNLNNDLQKYITKERDLKDDWSAWKDVELTILQFGVLCFQIKDNPEAKEYIYGKENITDPDVKLIKWISKKNSLDSKSESYEKDKENIKNEGLALANDVGLKRFYEFYTKNSSDSDVKEILLNKWQQSNQHGGYGVNVIEVNSTQNKAQNLLGWIGGTGWAWSVINIIRDDGAYRSACTNTTLIGQYLYYVDFGTNSNITTESAVAAPVSKIANFFKYSAYEVGNNSIKAGDVNPIYCFLYTIFVFQSLLYFFAYIKRFFYIIVLAIMAPIIVVYDFVSKM